MSCIEYKSIIHIVLQRKDQRSSFPSQAFEILKHLLHPCLWRGETAEQNAEFVEIAMLVQPELTHTDPRVRKVSVLSVCESVMSIPPRNIVSSPTAAVICHPGTLS